MRTLFSWAIAVCSLSARTTSHALDDPTANRSRTSGLAGGISVGTDMLGAHALYYHQLANDRWRLAAHAGVGFWPFADSKQQRSIGGAGGVMALFGRHHRLVIDLNATPVGDRSIFIHGEELSHRLVYGLGLAVGWEWMTRSGFFLRADVGPSLALERARPLQHRSATITFTGDLLALGFKLW